MIEDVSVGKTLWCGSAACIYSLRTNGNGMLRQSSYKCWRAVDFIVRSKEEKGRQTPRRKQNRVACTKTEINCGIPNYLVAIVHRMNECICVGRPKVSLSHIHNQQNGICYCCAILFITTYHWIILKRMSQRERKREKERGKLNENGRINGHNQWLSKTKLVA